MVDMLRVGQHQLARIKRGAPTALENRLAQFGGSQTTAYDSLLKIPIAESRHVLHLLKALAEMLDEMHNNLLF